MKKNFILVLFALLCVMSLSSHAATTLYSPNTGASITVADDDVAAFKKGGYVVGSTSVLIYHPDGSVKTIAISNYHQFIYDGWLLERPVMMYSSNGESKSVGESEVADYEAKGWSKEPYIKLWNENGESKFVKKSEVWSNKIYGWSENQSEVMVTMYATDGRSKQVYKGKVADEEAVGWYLNKSDITVTMYAPDGRTKEVFKGKVEAEKQVGWYTEPVVQMWAIDGRTKYVVKSKVQANKNVGWFDNKNDVTVTMYAPDGRTKQVFKANVSAEKAVGWTDNRADVFVLVYAVDGRIKEVPKAKVAENVKVGWSTTPVEPTITESSENHKFGNGILYVFGPSEIDYSNKYKGRSDIKTLYIYGDVKTVDSFAFDNCSNLSRVELSDTVTFLDSYCFDDTKLTRIGIPKSVTELNAYSFDNCGFHSYSDAFNKTNMVIYCEKGSEAESFAKEYNLKYVYATMIYSLDGKTMMVDDNEKRVYLASGLWSASREEAITMYNNAGATKKVFKSKVEAEKKSGWTTEPWVQMWAADGRSKYVLKSQVEANKKVGWYDKKSDVTTMMFKLTGAYYEVFDAKVETWKTNGWYTLDGYVKAMVDSGKSEEAIANIDNFYDNSIITASEFLEAEEYLYKLYYRKIGCPLAVISWSRSTNSIGTPEITITFRNVSNKRIVAFEQRFTCYDAYGSVTTDYPNLYNGNFTGYAEDRTYSSGKKFSLTWTLYNNERTYKISTPVVKRVAFDDGTVWKR